MCFMTCILPKLHLSLVSCSSSIYFCLSQHYPGLSRSARSFSSSFSQTSSISAFLSLSFPSAQSPPCNAPFCHPL
uniref:Secreted protein n=1 Tax=Octopus bimaculoides TaxID=37653 RepID=A0A0L8FMI8_OCTBM